VRLSEKPQRTQSPRVRQVKLRNCTLKVTQVGEGPPLLLINGIGANVDMWRPLAAHLALRHRLIMFDAPGTGGSTSLTRPMRMPGYSRLVVELLDALEIHRTDVLGYSWGGALAQQLAHDAPQRVRRVILASTSPGIGGRPPAPLVSLTAMSPARYLSKGFLRRIAPRIYGGDARNPSVGDHARLNSWQKHPPSYRGYASQVLAIGLWSSLPWLHRISAPVLIVQGDDDPLVPIGNGKTLRRRIPNSTLQIIKGGGHLWLLEHPDIATTKINRFLG